MTTPVWFHLCARHFHSPITISHLTMLCLCVHICFRLILPPCFPSRQRGPLLYHGSAASSIWFLLTQPYPSILFYFYCIQKVSSNVLSDGRDVGNFSHVLRVNQWRRLSRWNKLCRGHHGFRATSCASRMGMQAQLEQSIKRKTDRRRVDRGSPSKRQSSSRGLDAGVTHRLPCAAKLH
jgi:hypothetical protein